MSASSQGTAWALSYVTRIWLAPSLGLIGLYELQ
jgi:hypothetical protein